MKNNLYTIILFSIFAFACADGLGDDDCLFGATAECSDGTYSYSSTRSGVCSESDRVRRWCPGRYLTEPENRNSIVCDVYSSTLRYCCNRNTDVCEWSGESAPDDDDDTGVTDTPTRATQVEPVPSWECRQQDAEPRGRCEGNNLIYCDPTGVPRTVVCNSPDLTRRCGIDIENDMFDCLPGL